MHVDLRRTRSAADLEPIVALLERASAADGRRPFSERKWIDLMESGPEGLTSVLAVEDGTPVGVAQVSGHDDVWGIEVVVDPAHRGRAEEIGAALLTAALDAVAGANGGKVHLWVNSAGVVDDRVAAQAGLRAGRELVQMRRPLPVEEPYDLDVRPFEPGRDDQAWIAANNRAFAGHPEQGGWTMATLAARLREPWFDAEGFLLHERDGRLAGFCWTKIHRDHDPWLGEIYVIGVDPAFQGHGLGRPLVLAGLDSLSRRGAGIGMLYVDGENASAHRLYEDLGFDVHHIDRAYVGEVSGRDG